MQEERQEKSLTEEKSPNRRKRIERLKKMILLSIAAAILVPTVLCIVLGIKLGSTLKELEKLREQIAIINTDTVETQDIPMDSTLWEEQVELVEEETPLNSSEADEKTRKVYLTFDDGPSIYTAEILDILALYGVKATFFVVGQEDEESAALYKRIVDEGHTIGMHSYSNQYSLIYSSKSAFKQDYQKLSDYIYELTGTRSTYYRFPGGSGNEISNLNMAEFVHILNQEQITYFDWNVSAGDTTSSYTKQDVLNNVLGGVSKYKTSVVLLHDGDNKSTTVQALGSLIEQLQQQGAVILPIDENTKVIQYIHADSIGSKVTED